MFFAFSCNNFQLLETKKAAPEKWKTAKKIDLISYLNDIDHFIEEILVDSRIEQVFVTPKNIDESIKNISHYLSQVLNNIMHNKC